MAFKYGKIKYVKGLKNLTNLTEDQKTRLFGLGQAYATADAEARTEASKQGVAKSAPYEFKGEKIKKNGVEYLGVNPNELKGDLQKANVFGAEFIAKVFLKEPQCADLLKILSITIPFGTTQSCICGYYFGIHKAGVPSFAQLIEQTARIGCVFLLYNIYLTNKINITPVIAVIGLVFGEVISLIFTLTCFSFHPQKTVSKLKDYFFSNLKEITLLSTPLTISRISINLLGSLEAALIPHALKSYGMNSSTALSVYGILTGMALPFILFPNAVTGSISLMLLPAVSKSQAGGQLSTLKSTLQKSFTFCIMLGICCFFFFLLFGNLLGEFLFSSTMAGDFITVLAWICPFLYLNTTLSSVLNGLGKTGITFLNGIIGLFIRIGFIAFGVPHLGIHGYLFGLLASQLFLTASGIFFVHKSISSDKKCSDYRF
jgi:stage V sporulation protein B